MVTQKVTPINSSLTPSSLRRAAVHASEERQAERRKAALDLLGEQVATKLGVNIQRLHVAWDGLRLGEHPYVVVEGIILQSEAINGEPHLYARVTCPHCDRGSRFRTEINDLADLGDLLTYACDSCTDRGAR